MSVGPAETLVVDASLATKWHLSGEEYTDKARLILRRFAQGQTQIVAPLHICYEVPSAIIAATLGPKPRISHEQGQEAIEEFLALDLQTFDTAELILAAYALVRRYGCAFYDALYLALAQQLAVPLVTADRRFYQRIRHLPNVVWLGDYTPPQGTAG